ncbi:hypothetical protein [Methylobacterium symbioticum]|uniref:Uncharacterized protein n=1 Tax=Methylobacterium symbioticum TaxID=2584084 RepID=A0A509EI86_9HYPH|nr:hypothetical protein [Methylobacterium symbioticum]VUD72913.1 hypothetical protein MET9862_03520 [Methylobacterium symbioticum]
MPLDPVALAVAASFTAGCASIHALRRHADAVTLVLGWLAYGLATALGSALANRGGLLVLPDPVHAWGLVAAANI